MLMEKLKADAGEAVFEKAVSHYKSGNIKPYNYSQSGNNRYQIKAIVKASGAYGVNINLDFNKGNLKIDHYCTCPSGTSQLCEHAAAAVYKFIADDLPKLNPGAIKPAQFGGIEQLRSIAADPAEKAAFSYAVSGLDTQEEYFKLALTGPGFDETFAAQLIDCLGDLNYSARKRERLLSTLSDFDYLMISYLENHLSDKDSQLKTVSLPKSHGSLQFIITLIRNNRAVSYDTLQLLVLGEILKPLVYLSGDETRLVFSSDLAELEFMGFLNRDLNYVFSLNTLYPINSSGLEKLPPEVVIAPEQLGEVLFEILPQLSGKIRLELAPEFQAQQLVEHQPEISLNFDYAQEQVSCRPEIKLLDEIYRGEDCLRLLTGEAQYQRSPANLQQWLTINRQPFKELHHFLKRYKFEFAAGNWFIREQGPLLKFMLNGLQELPERWQITTSPGFAAFKIAPVKLEPYVKVDLKESIDWFDFEIYYNLGGATYTQQEILAMLRRTVDGSYIQAGGQWFFISDLTKMELLENNLSRGAKKAGPIRGECYNLIFLRQLLQEHGIAINGNDTYNRFEADISRANPVETCPLPDNLRGELRSYQKEGYYWLRFLHKYRFGGILADDMGLGKTLQVLTLVKSLPKREPVLVICPRSLIYNWAAEIANFYPGTTCLVYHGSPEARETLRAAFPEQEIIITTYDIIVNDIELLQAISFYYCILDEAQHIKNQRTQRAKDCKRINARYRLVLTGTPLENSLEDLWSLFDFLMPGYLESQNQFKTEYVEALKNPGQGEPLATLKKKITPFMLRRQKADVLPELPPKLITVRKVLLSQLQEDIYHTILKEVKQEILNSIATVGWEKSRIMVLTALTKLRQLCDHPSLALAEVGPEADSGKIEALMELIAEAIDGGHKIVVFSQFVRMLKLIRTELVETGINYVYLDGSTSDRMERINCFNNTPEIPVFLISLKAGGVGINLTAADIVIHVDPWWNPMTEDQATDRVHRIGQQKQVMVYKLITIGTVEEKLIKLQERKRALFDAVIQYNGDPLNSLTWEDIRVLFD